MVHGKKDLGSNRMTKSGTVTMAIRRKKLLLVSVPSPLVSMLNVKVLPNRGNLNMF
jgi:hypothetical protein